MTSERRASSTSDGACLVQLQDFSACVDGPPDVLDELRVLFPAPVDVQSIRRGEVTTRLEIRTDEYTPGVYHLVRDGVPIWDATSCEELLPLLEWAISTAAVDYLGRRYLLFHAGAVSLEGCGVMLPGSSGSGKTTLVAGLTRGGFQYLSDEVAVVDPSTAELLPFAKSLCVKAGARAALLPLFPELGTARVRHRFGSELVSFLPPPPASWSGRAVPLEVMVLPHYVPGADTRLMPIARSAAASVLLEQAFNARGLGAGAVLRAIELLRHTECFSLTIGALGQAVELVHDLVSTGRTR